MINVSEKIIAYVPILDKSIKQGRHHTEVFFYKKLLKLTREINELSSLVLELNDLKLELNLKEFDGLL